MAKVKTLVAALGIIGLGVVSTSTMADGASMAKDKCSACHGEDGNAKDPHVPNIAGFSETALHDMMMEFKDGDRIGDKFKPENGEETDMNKVTKDLSEDDINALAKYYAAQKYTPHLGKADEALAKKGAKLADKKCEKCHSDGGTNPDDDASLLAGQPREYLTRAFEKLSNGEQPMPKKMKKKFKKLKDEQKKALIEYYVSGGGAK